MKKLLAVIIVAVFLAALVPMNTISASSTTIAGPIQGLTHLKPGNYPLLSNDEVSGYDASPFLEGAVPVGAVAYPHPHSPWTVVCLDDYLGGFYYQDFEQVLSGAHCNIWIGLNDTVWTGGYTDQWLENGAGFADDEFFFALPWSYMYSSFSGRYLDGFRDYITGAQLQQIMDEFDNHIWQTDTSFFGQYADRPGPLGDYKIQILIFNIRDEFFWSPFTAPGFIEGYFWSYASDINNANIIHIDTHQWFRRQGPSPNGGVGVPLMIGPYTPAQCSPNEYEGTFAHEFQHLIHHDIDPNEYSWVNEGCSTLAEYINGYGMGSNLAYYITDFWETSLTQWEGMLANYGAVQLWAVYMYEHYGGQPFIWALVHEQANGIQGVNNVLKARKIHKTFDDIFQDWEIANYLDDTSFANGIYGYYGIDLPCAKSQWYDIRTVVEIIGAYDDAYPTGWILPERLPYVAWYWELFNGAPQLKVYFDGDDLAGVFPYSGSYQWHSDGTAYSWFQLGQTFAIPATGATLTFWSNYDIEEDWDYGYVEVHDQTTDDWYTLPGINTVTTLTYNYGVDNPNCPDDYEPTTYFDAGTWNAFTGSSGEYYQELMDLTPFAGHDIQLHFTYWTDPYTLGRGWYIDDIEIPELGFFDNVESGADGWTANAGWYITTGVIENDFKVNFIETINIANKKGEIRTIHNISPMKLNDATEDGTETLLVTETDTVTSGPVVLVAASQPGYEHVYYTEFLFIVDEAPFSAIHYWTH
jgi:hypothetical protein